ncbi:HPr kinase/phosphorylase [Blastomonas sp.]|uniref:HPr kinase/phosphorylase n=1 Tax=Blastomonas sp. TaxID=1909299 RepID=UPI00359364FA
MKAEDDITYPATCVAIGGRALLISGASGVGKSELALALIDRGARLISDDHVLLKRLGSQIIASAAQHIAGLIEVRNLGLMPMAVAEACPVALSIELSRNAPRWVEACAQRSILGLAIPEIVLFPGGCILAIKAEMALQAYGLKG